MHTDETIAEAQDIAYHDEAKGYRSMIRVANIMYFCFGLSMIMALISGNMNAAVAWLCALIMNMTHNGTTKSRLRILRMKKRFNDETRRMV